MSGCEIRETWLDLTSIVLAPMRLAMKRSRSGLMVRSSVRHGVPARLRSPCGVGGFAGEQSFVERPLHRVERFCLRFRQVAGEITQESRLAEASFIAIKNDAGRRRRRRKRLRQGCVIFASIGRARGHIDNRRDVRMHAGVGDDHRRKTNARPEPSAHPAARALAAPRDRVRQRRQRVLHSGHVEPRRLQSRNNFGPARSVGKKSVHKDDISGLGSGLRKSGGARSELAAAATVALTKVSTIHNTPPRFKRVSSESQGALPPRVTPSGKPAGRR